MKTISLMFAAALAVASTCALANTLTFQGVTFTTTDLGGGELELTIRNALTGAAGDWTGIQYLESFSIGNIGNFTTAALTGWTYLAGGLSNGSAVGCDGNGSGTACFYQPTTPIALTDNMVFDIFFTGMTDFSLPHLKIDFRSTLNQDQSTGSLLSQDISTVPLPGALPLFATALGGLGLLGWRRKRKAQAVV